MLDALIAAGIGAATSIFSAKSAKDTNKQAQASSREAMEFEAAQSAKQMEFQERMSSTAHQREVKDLISAGLNPILSANAGASTPSGAMGAGKTYDPENPAKDLPQNLMNSARLAADLKLTKAQTATYATQSAKNIAEADLANANAEVARGGTVGGRFAHIPISAIKRGITSSFNSARDMWNKVNVKFAPKRKG